MDSAPRQVTLQPPLALTGDHQATLATAFGPNGNLITLAPSPLQSQLSPSTTQQRQLIYSAQFAVDNSLRREFIIHSYTLFASLQVSSLLLSVPFSLSRAHPHPCSCSCSCSCSCTHRKLHKILLQTFTVSLPHLLRINSLTTTASSASTNTLSFNNSPSSKSALS
jgi:hypothetical protein